MGRHLLGGEIGCYLSHLEAARRFLADGGDFGLVLEDDFTITSDAFHALSDLFEWLKTAEIDWYLINIGTHTFKLVTPVHDIQTPTQTYTLHRAHFFPAIATGLIWSRAGAQAFVDQHSKIFAPVDLYFRNWLTRSGKGLMVHPRLTPPSRAGASLIEHPDDKMFRKSRTASGPRRWKRKRNNAIGKVIALAFKLGLRR